MKISGIDWMKNFQDSKTVQDSKIEKVRSNTSIAKESSWLDKPAKLFFKNSKNNLPKRFIQSHLFRNSNNPTLPTSIFIRQSNSDLN